MTGPGEERLATARRNPARARGRVPRRISLQKTTRDVTEQHRVKKNANVAAPRQDRGGCDAVGGPHAEFGG